MADNIVQPPAPALLAHGAEQLSRVTVDAYNAEVRNSEGFVGDRASKRAFQAILDDWRERLRKVGDDPFGDTPSEEISKKQLDKVLAEGDAEAAGVVHGAIEEFAQEFAAVIRRFLRLKEWRTRSASSSAAACARAASASSRSAATAVVLKAGGHAVELQPDPQRARPGGPHRRRASRALVDPRRPRQHPGGRHRRQQHPRRHRRAAREEEPRSLRSRGRALRALAPSRRRARSAKMRSSGSSRCSTISSSAPRKDGLKLAPFIGIGCPGVIRRGRLDRARRPEPARQLGDEELQPAAATARGASRRSAITTRWSSCTTTPWCRA